MRINSIAPALFPGSMFLLLIVAGGHSQISLNPVVQADSAWCWAASCEMVLDYYDKHEDQHDVAQWCVDGEYVPNYLCGDSYPGHPGWNTCKQLYEDRGVSGGCEVYEMVGTEEPAYSDFYYSIHHQQHPVHAQMDDQRGDHQAVFFDALEENNTKVLKYIDPADGEPEELPWLEIMSIEYAWLIEEVGVNDRIVIVEDNYYNPDVVHSNEHVHFKCYWHDVNETSWITEIKWEISFRYNGGTYHYVTNEKHRQNIKEVECPETRRRHDSIQNTCRRSAGRHCGQPGHQGTHYV